MSPSPLRWRRFFELVADLHDQEPRIPKTTVRLFRKIAALDVGGRVQDHRLDLLEPVLVGMDLDQTGLAIGSVEEVRQQCIQAGMADAARFLIRVLDRLEEQHQAQKVEAAWEWVESTPAEREAEEARRANVLARLRVS